MNVGTQRYKVCIHDECMNVYPQTQTPPQESPHIDVVRIHVPVATSHPHLGHSHKIAI